MKNLISKGLEFLKTIKAKQSKSINIIWGFFARNVIWFAIIGILLLGFIYIVHSQSPEEKILIQYKREVIEMQDKIETNIKIIEELKTENEGFVDKTKCILNQIKRIFEKKEVKESYCDNPGSVKNNEVSIVVEKKEVKKDTSIIEVGVSSLQKKIYRQGWDEKDERINWINFVLEKGGKDGMDMLLTFTGENGNWDKVLKSYKRGSNGYYDYGLCQMNLKYHKDFIGIPPNFTKEMLDPYKQLERCMGIYKNAKERNKLYTTFYAYENRWQHEKMYYQK